MKPQNKTVAALGALSMLGSVVAIVGGPPAITLYQNNGFFWWGFVPGLFLAAGFMAIVFAWTE